MTSIPQRFAGFRSAASVLDDATLTDGQKRAALLSWRAALQRGVPNAGNGRAKQIRMLREIEDALQELGESRQASG